MELNFNKEQENEFIKTITSSFKKRDANEFLKVFMTKKEASRMLDIFKSDYKLNDVYKSNTHTAKKSCNGLFDDINEFIVDIEECEVTTECKVQEVDGTLVTSKYMIFLKTPTTHSKVTIGMLLSIDQRLIWDGGSIDFDEVEPELEVVEFIGNYKDQVIDKLEGYLEYANKQARVYDNLTVKGDLDLDRLQSEGIPTLLIKGNLNVQGSIINEDGNTGTALSVEGNTNAKNLIAGGSIISLNDVVIEDFTVSFYNDGILSLNSLATNIFINNDHHTEIEDCSKINISIDYEDDNKGKIHIEDVESLAKYLVEEDELTDIVEVDDDEYYLNYDVINHFISKNKYSTLHRRIVSFSKTI